MELLPRTTHLISIHTQTLKVSAVLAKRASEVWVLHPDWLIYCRWSLSRACEATFMLNQLAPGQAQPNPPMDFSPLPPSALPQFPLPPPPPPLSAPLIGAGAVVGVHGDAMVTSGDPVRGQKRGREDEGGAANSSGRSSAPPVVEDNSMLSALKKLKAAGPSSNGNVDVQTASSRKPASSSFPPIPVPITVGAGGSGNGKGSSDRGPSPVNSSTSSTSRSQLFAHSSASTSAAQPTNPSKASSGNVVRTGAGPVAVIKKKATGALYLEDSPRGRGELAKRMTVAIDSNARNDVVPLDAGGGGDGDYDYFSPSAIERVSSEMHEQEHIFNDNDALSEENIDAGEVVDEIEEGEVREVRRSTFKAPASGSRNKSKNGVRRSEDDGGDSSSSDDHSLSGHHSHRHHHGRNGLKLRVRSSFTDQAEGKDDDENEYYLGSADEAEEAEEEEENWDKGMLCCNDDQGSTCSATGGSYLLLEDEDELDNSNDNNDHEEGEGNRGGRTESDLYRYGSNVGVSTTTSSSIAHGRSGAGVRIAARRSDSNSSISASNHSGSSDDEGSDFEVMMNRRRVAQLQNLNQHSSGDSGSCDAGFMNIIADGTIVESEEDFEYA